MFTLLILVQKYGRIKYGGVQTRLNNYLKYLPSCGIRPLVLSLSDYKQKGQTKYLKTVIYKYPKHNFTDLIFFLLRLFKKEGVAGVHVLEGSAGLAQLITLFIARLLGKKTALSVYSGEWIDILKRRKWQFAIKFICSCFLTSKIAANSRVTAKLLPSIFSPKITIVYPGVDTDMAKLKVNSPFKKDQSPRVLFVGRLFRRKGIDDLLLAICLLKKKFPRIFLTIIGDHVETSKNVFYSEVKRLGLTRYIDARKPFYLTYIYKALVKKLTLTDMVNFLSKVADLTPFYSYCDCVVLPSKTVEPVEGYEGFGNVILEAGLFKKPVVGTKHFGLPESVRDGITGILVPEADAKKLAESIRKILENTQLAQKMGESGYRRVIDKFSAKRRSKEFSRLFL